MSEKIETRDKRDLGAFIPAALDDYGLTPYEFRIYARLVRRAGKTTAYESVANLAQACKMSEQKVKVILRFLSFAGMVSRHSRPGASSVYTIEDQHNWIHPELLDAARKQASYHPGVGVENTQVTTTPRCSQHPGVGVENTQGVGVENTHKGTTNKCIHKGTTSMSCFDKHDSIASLPVLGSDPDVHQELPDTQQVGQTPLGKAEVARQDGSSGTAKNSQKSKKQSKAEGIYASLRSRETFEKFWKWYRDDICSIAKAKPGDKAEAAKAWQQLEVSGFFGCGLESFRLGCHLAKKAAIAAKGVGTKHACRFLGGGELGEPEWLTLYQEREDKGSNGFLTGVDTVHDLDAVRVAIAGELQRLDMTGVLPDGWQQKTGVASVGRLDLPQATKYLKHLRGLSHANAAA